jgi:hypothetical protein
MPITSMAVQRVDPGGFGPRLLVAQPERAAQAEPEGPDVPVLAQDQRVQLPRGDGGDGAFEPVGERDGQGRAHVEAGSAVP